MKALSPYATNTSGNGYPREDYMQWWAQGGQVYQKLISIPLEEIDAVGMQSRFDQLVGRWIDPAHHKAGIRPPETLGPIVSEESFGNLRSWIKQAKTLIYYVAYDESSASNDRRYSGDGPTTQSMHDIDEVDIAEEVEQIPGYTKAWHWPWIEGWDDPNQRHAIMHPKSNRGGFKKMVIAIGVSAAAIWAGSKVLGRNKNPGDPPQEEDYE